MSARPSLNQRYLTSLVLLAVVPVVLLGYLWIRDEHARFEVESQIWRDTHINTRKLFLQREVQNLHAYISFRSSGIDERLKSRLTQRAEAMKPLLDKVVLEPGPRSAKLARAANLVAAARIPGVVSLQLMDLESGQLLVANSLDYGESWLRRLMEAEGDGFVDSWHSRASLGAGLHRIVSYRMRLPEIDLMLIASGFPQELVAEVQQEIIALVASRPADTDNVSMFINTYDGVQLTNVLRPDANGEFLGQMTDTLGNPIFAPQLVAAEQPDGDYLELYWKASDGADISKSILYVTGFNDWRWILGAEFLTGHLDVQIAEQQRELEVRVQRHITRILLIVGGLVLLAVFVAQRLAARSKEGFRVFQRFFAEASRQSTTIDLSQLPYREFELAAEEANNMVVERSRYERELRLSEQRFRMALDASLNYLWDIDLARSTIRLSDGFVKKLGLEGIGRIYPLNVIRDRAHPDDVIEWDRAVLRLRNRELGDGLEIRLRSTDGQYYWYYCRGGVVEWDANGRPLRALGTVTDVGARKRMEQELKDARHTAEEASRAKSRFLSNISHELRTPLNGVLGYSQLLLRSDALSAEQREQLGAIEQCGRRLLELIDEVLDFSRADTGELKLALRSARLVSLMQEVVRAVQDRAEARGLALQLTLDQALPGRVRVDENKLRHVLQSLLARLVADTPTGEILLKAMPRRGSRDLEFQLLAPGLVMSEAAQRDVFQPFAASGQSESLGLGLGLVISQRIVEAMGGTLTLSSDATQGTCYRFDIPLVAVADMESPTHPSVAKASGSTEASVQGALPAEARNQLWEALNNGDMERLQRHMRQLERDPGDCRELVGQMSQRLTRFDLDGFRQLLESSHQAG